MKPEPPPPCEGGERRVLRRASLVGAMTAVSRVVGLLRELFMAYFFGVGVEQSAFVIAFRIPNLFRRLFGEGALGSAFTPVFTEVCHKNGPERAALFAARVMGILVFFLGGIVLLLIGATYAVEPFLAEGSRWLVALPLMRIMLPYAVLICLAAIVSAMLFTQGRFAIASLTPVVLNIVWIAVLCVVCLWLTDDRMTQITIVSWGILLAGAAQVAFQLPALRKAGFRFRLDFSFKAWRESPYIRRVLTLTAPAAMGIGLVQINICIDGWLAYYAAEWAPAALEYADRIVYLPLGMFATAFMTVLLPTFSKQAVAGDLAGLGKTLERALRNLTLVMMPAAIGLGVLSFQTVTLIYAWKGGKFDDTAAMYTARAILFYAPGLIIFSLQKCVTPAFYALQDLKTPVRIGAFCVLLNFTMNLLSIWLLPYGWQHAGMVGSTVISSLVNGSALALILHRRIQAPHVRAFLPTVAQALAAGALMGFTAWFGYRFFQCIVPAWGKIADLAVMFATMAASALVYGGALWFLARASVRELLADLPGRRRKSV